MALISPVRYFPAPRFWLAVIACGIARNTQAQSSPRPETSRVAGSAEAIELTPFEVSESKDDSYGSSSSISITGTRKELLRMPLSAEILNRTLLDDLGAHELREMVTFAAGTGAFMAAAGTSDASGDQPGDRLGTTVGTLRGLSVGLMRNGLFDNRPATSTNDGFSTDRIEVIRGPQALLYGATNVSGIIVVNSKRPILTRNSLRATYRLDNEGSTRAEIEANGSGEIPGTKQRVGLLVSAFDGADRFWRVNNQIESKGIFASGAWRLDRRLTVRADYEHTTRTSTDPFTARLSAPANDPTFGSRNNLPLRLLLQQGRARDIFRGALNFENADAFGTDVVGEIRGSTIASAQIESEIKPWLSVIVQGGLARADRLVHNSAPAPLLTPPGLGGNPTGEWALQLSPSVNPFRTSDRVWRGIANMKLPTIRGVKHELTLGAETRTRKSDQLAERWYEIDASGQFIRNAAQLNNGNSGRTVMPSVWWAPGTQGFDGPDIFRVSPADVIELNGRRYRRDFVRNQFPQFIAADNPLGFSNGSSGINYRIVNDDALFGTLSGEWFDGKVDTLIGYRYDDLEDVLVPRPDEGRTLGRGSHMLGLNWRFWRNLTAYYSHGTSFLVSNGLSTMNTAMPPGSGVGDEIGLKFKLWGERLSGTVSVYDSKAKNNTANLSAEAKAIVDAASAVNGRANGGLAYAFDRKTKGYEVTLVAAPIRGLRIQASFSHINANEGADVSLPILYNDQFNANAAGQVTLGNGSPLLVPVSTAVRPWNPLSPTPGVATQALTVDILRRGDANGNYRATLDPNSGAITNAAALFLNTPTVGTGVTGLPIARHQLGFTPPTGSTFLVRKGGDRTTDFPVNSLSYTMNYRVPEGRFRGLSVGGNVQLSFDRLAYYYTDRSNPAAPQRRLFTLPDNTLAMAFAGYEWRISKRFTLQSRINVSNVMNKVSVTTFPNLADGTPDNARVMNAPRVWAWTNTVRF
ncbi:MAG: TonB-dependent receptor plug domain-containing protein [Opitutaceae bacterium]|nr:TonB-dependent receptor plug domain-containing protein [Opitutaceae bacterium]